MILFDFTDQIHSHTIATVREGATMVLTAVALKAQETIVNIVDTLNVQIMFELFLHRILYEQYKLLFQLLFNLHLMNMN